MSENKTTLPSAKQYQRQLILIHNRMTNREKALRGLKEHVKHGTYPKRMNFLKSHPPVETPEGIAKVKEALQQVGQAILIEKVQDYERKLQGDRTSLQTLKETRRKQRQQQLASKATQTPKPTKKLSVSQLQQELRELQAKYTELAQNLPAVKPKSKESSSTKSKPNPKDIFS